MTNKLGFCSFAVFACLLFCAGIGFAADGTQVASAFLNSNTTGSFQSSFTPASSVIGSKTNLSFNPVDFSLSEASQVRLNNDNLGSLLQTGAVPEVKPKSVKKKIGQIMAIGGLGLLGAGTVMAIASGDPSEIGDSGMGINWRATGFTWIGVGLGVAIAGFILALSK